MVRATTAKSARSGTLCISASYLKFRFVSMHSLSVCSRRSFGTNQRTKGCGRVSTQFRCSPITATDEFLPHLPFLPSYVICNGYGDVLRSSASIAKSNSEIIAQVRVRGSPTPYNCSWIVNIIFTQPLERPEYHNARPDCETCYPRSKSEWRPEESENQNE